MAPRRESGAKKLDRKIRVTFREDCSYDVATVSDGIIHIDHNSPPRLFLIANAVTVAGMAERLQFILQTLGIPAVEPRRVHATGRCAGGRGGSFGPCGRSSFGPGGTFGFSWLEPFSSCSLLIATPVWLMSRYIGHTRLGWLKHRAR